MRDTATHAGVHAICQSSIQDACRSIRTVSTPTCLQGEAALVRQIGGGGRVPQPRQADGAHGVALGGRRHRGLRLFLAVRRRRDSPHLQSLQGAG